MYGPVAQLVERCIRIAEVRSSILLRSTIKHLSNRRDFCFARSALVYCIS